VERFQLPRGLKYVSAAPRLLELRVDRILGNITPTVCSSEWYIQLQYSDTSILWSSNYVSSFVIGCDPKITKEYILVNGYALIHITKTQPCERLTWLLFSVDFRSLYRRMPRQSLISGHDCFLPHPTSHYSLDILQF